MKAPSTPGMYLGFTARFVQGSAGMLSPLPGIHTHHPGAGSGWVGWILSLPFFRGEIETSESLTMGRALQMEGTLGRKRHSIQGWKAGGSG